MKLWLIKNVSNINKANGFLTHTTMYFNFYLQHVLECRKANPSQWNTDIHVRKLSKLSRSFYWSQIWKLGFYLELLKPIIYAVTHFMMIVFQVGTAVDNLIKMYCHQSGSLIIYDFIKSKIKRKYLRKMHLS